MNNCTTYKEKLNIANNFIFATNPYKIQPTLNFDLRSYTEYISENNLSFNDITPEIMNMFVQNT